MSWRVKWSADRGQGGVVEVNQGLPPPSRAFRSPSQIRRVGGARPLDDGVGNIRAQPIEQRDAFIVGRAPFGRPGHIRGLGRKVGKVLAQLFVIAASLEYG